MDRFSSAQRRRDLRLRLARHQIPEVLAWAGALTLVFGVVNYVTLPGESPWSWLTNLMFGPIFLAMAWVIHRDLLPDALAPWIWAACSLLLVVMLALVYVAQPSAASLAYLVAVMTAFGPITHAWPPFWAAGAGMLAVALVAFRSVPGTEVTDDILVCAAGLLISAVLLRLRMKALTDLADSQERLDHQATYDPMTDVLNRNGLTRAVPSVSAAARRSGGDVLVWFVDVRGLKQANDRHGHAFGDAIIRETADALRACVRANDLVARWGGDEFLVIGEGVSGSAEDLNARVDARLRQAPGLSGRWSGAVTVGFARGPADADVDSLIAQADADMYRRRTPASG